MSEFTLLAQRILTLQRSTKIPGISIAVVRNGQIVYHAGFGHEGEDALTAETPFEVASLSKPLFAYAVLKLCEQGILHLDTPISDYLPTAYPPDEPYLPFITVRHALSHTTGFPNWRDESGLRAAFRPGTKFHYSTEGLIYLQTALEYIIQQPFHQYARKHIFEPFGMSNSEFLPIEMSGLPDYLPRHLYSFGAVSLKTTAVDYAHFLTEMMADGVGDAFRLSEPMLVEMLTPQIQVGHQEGLFWGLGWGIHAGSDGRKSFWHWGQRRSRTRNFVMGSYEERSGVVILTNLKAALPFVKRLSNG
jgi:CubicO group peptidase (beta-lactamase class C family)